MPTASPSLQREAPPALGSVQRNGKYVGTRTRFNRAAILLAAGLAVLLVLAALALVPTGVGSALGWWLTNTTPPQLAAAAPANPQRSVFTLTAAARPAARVSLVDATLDGAPIAAAPVRGADSWIAPLADAWWLATHPKTGAQASDSLAVPIDTTHLADGPHTVRLQLEDRSLRHLRAVRELTFVSDNTPPRMTLAAPAQVARAGQPVALRLSASKPAALRASAGGDALPLFALGGGDTPSFVGFLGTSVEAPATSLAVSVHATDLAGNTSDASATVSVQALQLPKQDLDVPPSLANLATGPVATAEAAQVASLTSAARPERLWKAPFKVPFPAAVRTTDFGERRDYPDGYVTYHAGYDLAVPLGAPIPAAADGIVVFAGPLPQRGSAVVLDHGWGVYTVYGHSSRIEVQVGQSVAQGQTIALVGSTGLSTGAHLHWEVRLRGVPVDPGAWVALTQGLG